MAALDFVVRIEITGQDALIFEPQDKYPVGEGEELEEAIKAEKFWTLDRAQAAIRNEMLNYLPRRYRERDDR